MMNKNFTVAITMALSGVMAACTVGPDYQAPALQSTEFTEVTPPSAGLSPHWWRQFADETLDRLVLQTLTHNFNLAAARANIAAAHAVVEDVGNDQLPKGSMASTAQYQQQLLPGISTEVTRTESFRSGVALSWTLDLFGKISRTQELALADYQASQYALQDIQLEIVAQVVNTYSRLAATELQLDIAGRTLDSLRQTEQVVVDRVAAGYASDFDLLRVQSQVVAVEADIPELQVQMYQLEATLSALTGQQSVNRRSALLFMQQALLIRPVAVAEPVALLRQRADIRLAERQLAAATAGVGIRQADLYPELSISGFLGFLSADSLKLNHGHRAWSLAPTLSWQAFDLASVKARVKVATAQQQGALARLQHQWLTAVTQTKAALQIHVTSQQREAMLQRQVGINQKMLQLARFQYQAGTLELLDLLDAERVTLASEYQQVAARQQNMASLIELYRVFGGGLTPASAEQVFAKVQ